ncbi:conserved membrane hypothetical protein [Candidatus Zixiibacteriota bacterium]|nr:conserved membrane hypothetical protein [candidate division Zixibacteria bacterium]
MKNFLKYHLPAIIFGILIFSLSSISHLNLPRIRSVQVDKILHFTEYAIFSALVFRSFSHFPRPLTIKGAMISTFLVMAAFASGDEIYQGFIPGRHRDWSDLAADLVGAILVLTLLAWRRRVQTLRNAG